MEFLKMSELTLNPANYLISKVSNKPVTHISFVNQQQSAEYIVRLSQAVKGKNFSTGPIDNLQEIKAKVLEEMNSASVKNYVSEPTKPTSKVQDELTEYALNFAKYLENKESSDKINMIMQEYNTISAIEEVGDYFQEGLVRMNKIYTIEEILAAVKLYTETVG